MSQHEIYLNWKKNPVKPPLEIKAESGKHIDCLLFSENIIVNSYDGDKLYVWSADTGEVCIKLKVLKYLSVIAFLIFYQ